MFVFKQHDETKKHRMNKIDRSGQSTIGSYCCLQQQQQHHTIDRLGKKKRASSRVATGVVRDERDKQGKLSSAAVLLEPPESDADLYN